MPLHPVVLIVEDDADWLEIYSNKLASDEYTLIKARTVNKASNLLAEQEFAVVATDLKLVGAMTGGFDILRMVQERSPDTQVIIFTGFGGKQDAFEAMRRGAYDYVTKPLDYDHVKRVIKSAIDVRQQKLLYRRSIPDAQKIDLPFPQKFVGSSRIIKRVLRQVAAVIESTKPVLIWGASGTGKALITETIHLASKRKRFVLVNCGVYSETTLDRNLFGFHKGAFLGANEDQPGLLEQASGGTLVLDRVGGLSPRLQKHLLDVLSQQHVRRIGSRQVVDIDVRVLATSPVDLATYVEQGLFSRELYQYLSASIIRLPLLKERRDEQTDDVLLLAGYFLDKYASGDSPPPTISESARDLLQSYDFPQNARELENAIRIAVIRTKSGVIEPQHLPEHIQAQRHSQKMAQMLRTPFPEDAVCPCGRALSKRAEVIAQAFDTGPYVYLSSGADAPPWYRMALEEAIVLFGLKLYEPAHLANGGIFCQLCQPILSSHLAIVDISASSMSVFYDLGMAHALGLPYIALKRRGIPLPDRLAQLTFLEYDDAASLKETIITWLNRFVSSQDYRL